MTYLSGRTRKVTTYGKKATRIINVHSDFSPSRNPSPPVSESTPVRRPLFAKVLQESNSQPSTPLRNSSANVPKTPRVGKTPLKTVTVAEEPLTLRQHVARSVVRRRSPRSPIALASPGSPKERCTPPKPLRGTRKRRGPITPPGPIRGVVEVEVVTSRLQQLSVDDSLASESGWRGLLDCATSKSVLPFSGVFNTPDFAKLLSSGAEPVVTKLGEASYSEVFIVGEGENAVVVKVVPLLGSAGPSSNGKSKVELPDCSEIADVVREIEITKRMSLVPGGGFVEFLGSFVVEGVYPEQLLEEWDRHRDEHGTESLRPDSFSSSQRYSLIVLANGGQDLESYKFENSRGWVQAAAVFWQVADSLARAEKWTEFEHRDLHEGQILINDVESSPPAPITNYLDSSATGVRATVIDFGLSRLDMPEQGAVWTPLPEEVYEGVGDQWDVYRAQRSAVEYSGEDGGPDAWGSFHAPTNALWLKYLVGHLLRSTRTLRKPYARHGRSKAKKSAAQLKADILRSRAEEAWGMLQAVETAMGASGRRAKDLTSAAKVVAWGREMGWVA